MLSGNQLHMIDLDRGDHYRNPYPQGFEPVTLPDGASGDWRVSRFSLTEDQVALSNLRLIRDGQWRRIVPPGTYTRLVHSGEGVVMSDTPAEAHEHQRLYHAARGHVLMNGLGLGFALSAILRKPEVARVTVVERSADVIRLVAPTFEADHHNVTIICADALIWRPDRGERFDVVWHDIWTTICDDNKPEMTRLRRAYARRCAWQSCWSEEYLR
jgi:hypothetical protein